MKQVSRERFQGGSNDHYLLANSFDDEDILASPDELIDENDDESNYSGDGGGEKDGDKSSESFQLSPLSPQSSNITTSNNVIHKNSENCSSNQFQCLDGNCIDLISRCDQRFDCNDGSDEISCGTHLT